MSKSLFCFWFVFLSMAEISATLASGMVPETSLLLVNEADKSSTINIKNTDDAPELLYTRVVDLPDDKGTHLVVTQPVARVDPGQIQQLRFLLTTDTPLKTEHMKRVTFEGIPPATGSGRQISINIRQDIPVLIHPVGLPEMKDVWTLLSWHKTAEGCSVKNPSPYVVRLAQSIITLPSGTTGLLPKTYLLPGEEIVVAMKNKSGPADDHQVRFFPASRYGVQVPDFTAPLN